MPKLDLGLDYLDQIDIALLAPSRTGKSTLIAAMLAEFNRRLSQKGIGAVLSPLGGNDNIYAFTQEVLGRAVHAPVSTQAHINGLQRDYSKALKKAGKRFAADIKGTRDCSLLSFNLANEATAMPFRILDYPGGAVSSGTIAVQGTDASGLEDHARVLRAYMADCFAVVVPVFAMALVEQSELDSKFQNDEIGQDEFDAKSDRLNAVLNISDIRDRVTEWVLGRVESRKHGLLILAPVKCETFLNAPGNPRTRFEHQGILENVTHEYVFDPICRDIVSTVEDEEKLSEIAKLVSVEYLPVQTFGNVFERAMLEWPPDLLERADDYENTFKDLYYKKAGAVPNPSGAAGVIQTILAHRNTLLETARRNYARTQGEELDRQGFFERIWKNITGKNAETRTKISVSLDEAKRMNDFVAQIASLGVGTKNLRGWQWDFSDGEIPEDDPLPNEWED